MGYLGFSDRRFLITLILFLILLFEGVRVANRWLFFGQRLFESYKVSSMAWSLLGLSIIFYVTDDARYIYPVVFLAAFLDPLVGELKPVLSMKWLVMVSYGLALLIWFCSSLVVHAWPFWYGIVVAGVSLLMSIVNVPGLDDNVTMLVLPLVTLEVLSYFQ